MGCGWPMERITVNNNLVECDVCGKQNEYVSYSEDIGVVERHYFCNNCGFFVEQAYSSVLKGIALGDKDMQSRRKEYEGKINKLKLETYDI